MRRAKAGRSRPATDRTAATRRRPRSRDELRRRRARRIEGGDGRGGDGGALGGPTSGWDGRRIRRWVLIGMAVVGILFVLGLAGGLVNLLTDLMWYGALGRRDVLTTRLTAQIVLFVVGFAGLRAAGDRQHLWSPQVAPQVPASADRAVRAARRRPAPARWVTIAIIGVALLLALGSGGRLVRQLGDDPALHQRRGLRTVDPNFGRDIGFYVFDLPVLRFLQGLAVTTLVVVILLTAGDLRGRRAALAAPPDGAGAGAPVDARRARCWGRSRSAIQFDIAELSYSTRTATGRSRRSSYTDINAQVPAFVILTVVASSPPSSSSPTSGSRPCGLLGLTAAAWVGVSILVGGVYPSLVQRLRSTRTSSRWSARTSRSTSPPRARRSGSTRSRSGASPVSRPLTRRDRERCGHDRQPAAVGLPATPHHLRAAADHPPATTSSATSTSTATASTASSARSC